MAFRVYDTESKKMMRGTYYLGRNGDLFSSENKMFGNEKLSLMPDLRYTWHNDIGFEDKNGRLIYEGDICKIETSNKFVKCVVAYIPTRASYMLLSMDDDDPVFYGFYEEIRDKVEVISNVFDEAGNEDVNETA